MTLSRREISDLLHDHDLHPSRALGQNFVTDPNTVRRIARLADLGPGEDVVEIGAGLGSLTLALAETGARVTAIEIDRRIVPVLRAVVAGTDVRVIEADALSVGWDRIISTDSGGPRWSLVANLPYNVAVPVVVRVLEEAPKIHRMLVMVQREVGERLAASPGDRSYGGVSVKVSYYAEASVVGRVPPTVFLPRPNVESVLVRILRREEPAVARSAVSEADLFAVVRAGFAHRRKMLRRSLAGIVEEEAFEAAGISASSRPEELDVVEWGRLVACHKALTSRRSSGEGT